jgi:hypothetical protein
MVRWWASTCASADRNRKWCVRVSVPAIHSHCWTSFCFLKEKAPASPDMLWQPRGTRAASQSKAEYHRAQSSTVAAILSTHGRCDSEPQMRLTQNIYSLSVLIIFSCSAFLNAQKPGSPERPEAKTSSASRDKAAPVSAGIPESPWVHPPARPASARGLNRPV